MEASLVKRYKEQLLKEKEILTSQVSNIEKHGFETRFSHSIGELSLYDNHPADVGSEMFERSKDIALIDNAKIMINNIDAALEKIEDGSYGICNKCGAVIPIARLDVVPWATLCIKCQQISEREDSYVRPVEEEVLDPPFHRTFLDDYEEFVGFDGEDTLQDVLKYGSSDTPQDIPGSYSYKANFPNSNEHQGIVERTDAIPSIDE